MEQGIKKYLPLPKARTWIAVGEILADSILVTAQKFEAN